MKTGNLSMRLGLALALFATLALSALGARSDALAQQATPEPNDPCLTIDAAGTATAGGHGMMGSMAATPASGGAGMGMMSEFDLMFIDMMIPHHQEAVDMAQVVLNRSTNPDLIALAEAVISAQSAEIAMMNEWRTAWYPDAGDPIEMPDQAFMDMMGMGQGAMMMAPGEMLAELCAADDVDLAFLQGMIPHHESAIMMGQAALTHATHDELKQLAQAIVETQTAEITLMRDLIAGLTGTPAAGS